MRRTPTKRDIKVALAFNAAMYGDKEQQAAHPYPKQREIRRPADGKPVGPSEHQLQSAVIAWWDLACKGYSLPPIALFAIPNGGARDIITGARLKAEGVRRGVVDLFLARPIGAYRGFFIEMKAGDNKPSDKQEEFIAYVKDAGYWTGVYWTSEDAISAIKEYLG